MRQNLNQNEVNEVVAAMEAADFGPEIEIETVDTHGDYRDEVMEDEYDIMEEDDGQPSEYDEWQDFYGGDDWDHGQYDETF